MKKQEQRRDNGKEMRNKTGQEIEENIQEKSKETQRSKQNHKNRTELKKEWREHTCNINKTIKRRNRKERKYTQTTKRLYITEYNKKWFKYKH